MLPRPDLVVPAFALVRDAPAALPPQVAWQPRVPGYARANVGVNIPPGDSQDTAPSPTVDAVIVTTTPPSTPADGPPNPPPPHGPGSPHDNEPGECRLLGSFAILVQLALGGLALLSLVYKRWRERPQRPVKIWFFDVSKQVFGSVLVHVANVFMSMLTSGRLSIRPGPKALGESAASAVALLLGKRADEYIPNPCSFYLLNLAIDTTLGIPILIFLLRLTTKLVAPTRFGQPPESIQSGNYGNPPNALWWLKQSIIYFCGLMGMKVCVLIIFMMFPWISRVGDWALGWTEGNEKLQIFFVMMLFPLIMNALQYYIIDSFIKAKELAEEHETGEAEASTYAELSGSESSDEEVSDDDDDEDGDDDNSHIVRMMKSPRSPRPREYDPIVDGDSQTVIGSSTSTKPGSRGQILPKELLPRE
ncbi:hypothetical protein GQ53DRAFT_697752 [Thozetella sp. PMI_491]|nr:hypothetical protein GQ53DRAFT_697752 [Thozetella sp. PMI_491]